MANPSSPLTLVEIEKIGYLVNIDKSYLGPSPIDDLVHFDVDFNGPSRYHDRSPSDHLNGTIDDVGDDEISLDIVILHIVGNVDHIYHLA